jgi:hypothetical protein
LTEHCDNIGERGVRQRKTLGATGLVISILGAIALIAGHAPRATRLLLALPIDVSAAGFLVARERN